MGRDGLKPFFVPMVRRAFGELGLGEWQIIEYVSDVLAAFARADHLYRLRSVEGKSIDSVVEMLADLLGGSAGRLRKAYFAPAAGEDPFADFLQQVEGWMRVGVSKS